VHCSRACQTSTAARAARFWSRVQRTDTCWLWLGGLANGYGMYSDADGTMCAHRFAYTITIGAIPEGLQLDHLCRVRNCVNPEHLEPVTPRTNTLRSNTPQAIQRRQRLLTGVCRNGHPIKTTSTTKRWRCTQCESAAERERRRARREMLPSTSRSTR
jgi:hypothetical protein